MSRSFCYVQWFDVRGSCLHCSYWLKCWPSSMFKLSFHKICMHTLLINESASGELSWSFTFTASANIFCLSCTVKIVRVSFTFHWRKNLKIPKRLPEVVNWKGTNNILTKIERRTPEGLAVPVLYVVGPIVWLLNDWSVSSVPVRDILLVFWTSLLYMDQIRINIRLTYHISTFKKVMPDGRWVFALLILVELMAITVSTVYVSIIRMY